MPQFKSRFSLAGWQVLAFGIASLAAASQAEASSLQTFTVSIAEPQTSDTSLILPQFDDALGSLTQVALLVRGTTTKSSSATAATSCFGSSISPICVTGLAAATAFASLTIEGPLQGLEATDSLASVDTCRSPSEPGGTCTATAVVTVSVEQTWVFDSPGGLTGWLNQTPLAVLFDIEGGATLSSAEATVSYNYIPAVVPAPTSGLALAGGLAVLAMRRHRRTKG